MLAVKWERWCGFLKVVVACLRRTANPLQLPVLKNIFTALNCEK